ncbi:hypothetical protein ACFLQ2_02830 [archaeon]
METLLQQRIKKTKGKLVEYIESYSDTDKKVSIHGHEGTILVSKDSLMRSFSRLNKKPVFYEQELHYTYAQIRRMLPLVSTPPAFIRAWQMRDRDLDVFTADKLVSLGAQLLPTNKKSRILRPEEHGVLLSKNKLTLLAFRHSFGNYKDEISPDGTFVYQPPLNWVGMLRYRFTELLAKELYYSGLVLVVMWFDYKIDEGLNQVFIICPGKIKPTKRKSRIQDPVEVQLLGRNDAMEIINGLFASEISHDIKQRRPLDEEMAMEYSFENLKGHRSKKLKSYARKHAKTCPGTGCEHKPFADILDKDLAFGHIIPQNWASKFTFLHTNVNHPDNLYLTCKWCNSSLGDNFPDSGLVKKIEKNGTIGEWVRKGV